MNTNRDASSYTERLMAQAILQGKRMRTEDVNAGRVTVPTPRVYDYSVLVPANAEVAFQPIAPWLYTSETVPSSAPAPQEIYGYPLNSPQIDVRPNLSLTYSVDSKNYTISVSSVFGTNINDGHSFTHLFNDLSNDVWASVANEHLTTMYAGLGYYGAWIRVELPFAIYPTGVRLTSRQGQYICDQRPKEFRVYGTNEPIVGEEGWTLLYDSSGASWPYSGGATSDQTKECVFSSNQSYCNYLIIMHSNHYDESTWSFRDMHIKPYIALAEYKILGYPDPSASAPVTTPSAPTNLSASSIASNSVTIDFTSPTSDGGSAITNYEYSLDNGTTFIARNPESTLSPIIITGLTASTSYSIKLRAVNAIGAGLSLDALTITTSAASAPRSIGTAKMATSFYDNANLGYTTFNSNFSKMSADSLGNIIVAGYYRTSAFTINRPDTNGLTQINALTKSFDGSSNITTNYVYNLFVTKYSSSNVPLWSAKISGTTNVGMNIYSVECDSNNNVYALFGAGGYTTASNNVTIFNADDSAFGSINNVFGFGSSLSARYFLVKYNSAGVVQWINSITAGDNNNQSVLITAGNITIDGENNVYMTAHIQRAGGGTGATSVKFYKYNSVSAGVIQDALATSDSYAFMGNPMEYHRSYLIKLDSNGTYKWISRMTIPTAWGENNGGGINGNVVIDSANNVYVCQNSVASATSPTCNIYNGVDATINPLPALTSSYYRFDLRGASITPSLPQYYKYVAILKFNSNGVFQGACGTHQLHNGSVSLGLNGYIEINKANNSLYMVMNAQGFTGTNASSGAQLDKLYINSFSMNDASGSNYNIKVANSFNLQLTQPQTILAVIKFNTSLQAQSAAYIDTPGGNPGGPYGLPSGLSIDSLGNLYIATTIKDSSTPKTIYTFNAINGSAVSFNTFASINATNANSDGLIVSYNGDLTSGRWATLVASSDGLNDNGLVCKVNADNYIFVGGNSELDKNAASNSIAINSFSTITSGIVQNTLFGNLDVTNAVDRAGFLIKYE